jgi:hypothetical protein
MDEATQTLSTKNALSRTSHEVTFNAQYDHSDWLLAKVGTRSYFSNTLSSGNYTNLFPFAGLSLNFAELLDLSPLYELKLYSTLSTNLREGPLLYNSWAYGSARMPIEQYNSFYEDTELFFNPILSPEMDRKFESGLRLQSSSGLEAELTWFRNLTTNFIAPQWTAEKFELQNVATIKNNGVTFSGGYSGRFRNGHWQSKLAWTTYNNTVEKMNGNADTRVPLAGFQTIQSVITEGKPLGAIYGSSYLRNESGQKIIGSDGFPIKDAEMKMLGNPIPDWTLGWSSNAQWRQFRLEMVIEVKKGGEVWNGTNAMLDYLGRSANTGKLRNTSGSVFDGVDVNNNTNIIPVSFADPAGNVNDNRWTRYGWDGVAEDYIEDASWIRLNELVLSWGTRMNANRGIKEIRFSLTGRNLFLITPYSGVDPSATLLGYATSTGLDVFNAPATRSYSAQLTFKI